MIVFAYPAGDQMKILARVLFAFIIGFYWIGVPQKPAKGSSLVSENQQSIANSFSPPLGFRDGVTYAPRYTRDANGALIENTDYGIKNPDLSRFSNCFGTPMSNLYHAGQDLYRVDHQSTYGAEVTSVADGTVFNSPSGNYPGKAIVISHSIGSGQTVYSVYMHLENVAVVQGQFVTRGQRLGTVMYQPYDGNFPQYHPAPLDDDSHLHFEMRLFASAANIYSSYPDCNLGDAPGRGYSVALPDNFPTPPTGYRNPRIYLSGPLTQRMFFPLLVNNQSACTSGSEILLNEGFEAGHSSWVEAGYNVITNTSDPYLTVSPYAGSWLGWMGGRNNASDLLYQDFPVDPSASGGIFSYFVWMESGETGGTFDYFYVMLRNSNGDLIQQLDTLDNSYASPNTWVQRSLSLPNLSAFRGQNVRISFEAITDANTITSFYVDDVSLKLGCVSTGVMPSGVKETMMSQGAQKNRGGRQPGAKPPLPTPTAVPNP
jgi:murein DD-endopeptidase MepM/ murein hydrolase activator NlpD